MAPHRTGSLLWAASHTISYTQCGKSRFTGPCYVHGMLKQEGTVQLHGWCLIYSLLRPQNWHAFPDATHMRKNATDFFKIIS